MKNKVIILAVALSLTSSISLMAINRNNPLLKVYTESSSLRVEDTQKTIYFYQRMLESWCRTYFRECFDCNYKKNSLGSIKVLECNANETRLVISGIHSYSGWFDHNDVPFKARITYKGGNDYEVWFQKGSRSSRISETTQSATRSITYWE